ncbi:gypsy/ty3 element polyprotein [Cucumis melo var. makuwa]|uniref:Gypsy/ty3 element polyprotein n=1 Tax=Cucumis melo var. makuwa TaxID=1194695 RepID=A0A5D3DXX5_CUCMM|nr:gypsy/ty3 element polyprotein [Cucumis melo var. makuwa]
MFQPTLTVSKYEAKGKLPSQPDVANVSVLTLCIGTLKLNIGIRASRHSGKRKVRTEEVVEEEIEEGETSLSMETGAGQDRIKFKKLEISVFNGKDPDGKGLSWFRWSENCKRFRSWKELKEGMYNQFRSREHETSCARFLAIRQEGTIKEYLQWFKELSAPLSEIAKEVLEGTFTNGLDPIIWTEVFSMLAVDLEDMMEAAQLVEEKNEMAKGSSNPYLKETKMAQKITPKIQKALQRKW